MPDLIKLIGCLFFLVIVIVGVTLAYLIIKKLNRTGGNPPAATGDMPTASSDPPVANPADERTPINVPYRIKKRVLTANETNFLPVLRQAVAEVARRVGGPGAVLPEVLCMVRLADILEVDATEARSNGGRGGWQTARNRIDRKHVDFVICAHDTFRPILIVELDDASHERPDRRERDAFVDSACNAAGLPILHVPAARRYEVAPLAAAIAQELGFVSPPAPRA